MSGLQSTGRGGAGNIADASKSPRIVPSDLETPTLKTAVVTTGRGGSGNMAQNVDPAETRARQDVAPVQRRPSVGATHVGRGGAANVANVGKLSPEPRASSDETGPVLDGTAAKEQDKEKHKKEKERGLAAKAKDFFKRT
ncbi:hypothetical protein F5Y17DRAFT_457265 [Xylariaceae sp. FL0594]|nr:hypothetical protein F5Y17DRAFT_457265 [Xylariaceae sp. FL0594]